MASRLFLIRHCPTVASGGTFIGATDLELDPDRADLVQRLDASLPARAACRCSPLRRARQTCGKIAHDWAREPILDPRLREIDFGRWEGRTFADIAGSDPQLIDQWQADYSGFTFPEGESVADFHRRIGEVAEEMRHSMAVNQVLVSHGGPIRTLICLLLGLPPSNYLLFNVDHGRLTIIDLHSQGGVLAALNI